MKDAIWLLFESIAGPSEMHNDIYASTGYLLESILIVLIPLLTAIIFYKVIDDAKASRTHWVIYAVVSILLVFAAILGTQYSNAQVLSVVQSYDYQGYDFYVLSMAITCAIWGILFVLLWSFILGRTISINNRFNPF